MRRNYVLALTGCILLLCFCGKQEKAGRGGDGNIDLPIEGDTTQVVTPSDYAESLFSILDLDYPGLERVKIRHQEGNDAQALTELREYYRSRTNVLNPYIDLVNPGLSAGEKNIADQACREKGYRLYVRNYQEGTDPSTGLPIYWSFADDFGNLDWNARPGGITETQFAIQRHRHQWMESQAKAYRATGETRYIEYIKDIYGSWLKTYPFPGAKKLSAREFKDQWTDLQATSRIMAQVNILQYCVRSDSFTTDFLALFLVEFANTVECLRANPYYKDDSNHRLFEVQALFTAAVMMPEFAAANDWLEEALGDIARQVHIQFRSDGVQVEMDPSYHIAVLNTFYDMHLLAARNGLLDRFPSDYTECLRAAAGFVRDIMYTDYSMDNFNDTRSSSWTKRVLQRNLGHYAEMFPDEPGLEWLFSDRVRGSAPSSLSSSYPVSGYYILRDGWEKAATMFVLKNNENSAGWWHCQPDNGTFGLYRNGRRFTPDAGSYSYGGDEGDNAVRADFQATAVHNTLSAGLANIAEDRMKGRLLQEVHLEDGTDGFITANDSYPGLTHKRSVYFVKRKFFVILDEASGSGAYPSVELSFHLCGGLSDVTIDGYASGIAGAHTVFSDGNNMIFKTFAASSDGFTTNGGQSWYSDSIGQKVQRRFYRVSAPKQAGSPLRFATVIFPCDKNTNFATLPISASFSDESLQVNVDGVQFETSF